MKVIGLTGGIASGKSTVTTLLQEKDFIVLDADRIARQLAEPGQAMWQAYVDRYGEQVLLADNALNRQAVADIVFRQPEERQWMDGMAHPLIQQEIQQRLEGLKQVGYPVVFLDVPLLFETGWEAMVDETWVVYVEPELQLARLRKRNGYSIEEAQRRIGVQMPLAEKRRRADRVIMNNGSEAELRQVVEEAVVDFLAELPLFSHRRIRRGK